MKGMKMRTILCILAIVGLVTAQTAYNVKLNNFAINGFRSDSLKTSSWFAAGDAEGADIIIKAPTQDSSKFVVGYQRGYWDGGQIVWKRPTMVIDTFNTLVAGNFQAAGSFLETPNDSDLVAAIDSAQISGTTLMAKRISTFRSPYARIVLKGLTGNKNTAYSVFVTVSQPKYVRVDVGSGKQPE